MEEYMTTTEIIDYVMSDYCTYSEGQIREILYSLL